VHFASVGKPYRSAQYLRDIQSSSSVAAPYLQNNFVSALIALIQLYTAGVFTGESAAAVLACAILAGPGRCMPCEPC
jgi:hypothetical protein